MDKVFPRKTPNRSGCTKSQQTREMPRAKTVLAISLNKVVVVPKTILKPPDYSSFPRIRGTPQHKTTSVAFIRRGAVGCPKMTVKLCVSSNLLPIRAVQQDRQISGLPIWAGSADC